MHLIEVTPAPCCVCGKGNTPDAHGDRSLFVDFERDINWNEPLIICEDCVSSAGGMVGMASKSLIESTKRETRDREKVIHRLKAHIDTMEKRARRLGVEFTKATT